MLSRYLLRLLSQHSLATLAVLSLVYSLLDLADAGRRLAPTLGWSAVLLAAALRLPAVSAQLAPAALLLGGALALAKLQRRGELEAMQSLGASPLAVGRPLLALGGMATLLTLGGAELATGLERRADALYQHQRASILTGRRATPGSSLGSWRRQGSWLLRQEAGRVLALKVGAGLRPERRLDGHLTSDGTHLEGVRELLLGVGQTRQRRHQSLALKPLAALRSADRGRIESRGLGELLVAREQARSQGRSPRLSLLLLHLRLAFPALCVPVAIVLWGLAWRRRGHLVARAVGWVATLWLLTALGFMAARSGLCSAALGAWAPVLLTSALALGSLARRSG